MEPTALRSRLALALLVLLIDANDVNAALAANHLAVLANPFHAGADFHRGTYLPSGWKAIEYMGLAPVLTSRVEAKTPRECSILSGVLTGLFLLDYLPDIVKHLVPRLHPIHRVEQVLLPVVIQHRTGLLTE